MQKNVLPGQKTVQRVKCIKCKSREATDEDQMCDNCRFMATIEGILKKRKS